MTSKKSPQEQKLWDNWLQSRDNEAANELIQNYMYLVNFHVDRIARRLPSNVYKDDLKSFGLMGLFDALIKYEASRDLKFDTYATFRVRGAIIDGLRTEDWLPRSVRDKTKKIEQVSQDLEQLYQRVPRADEIAEKLDMPAKEVESLIRDTLFANVLSIDEKPKTNSNKYNESIGYSIPDEASILPDEHMVKMEVHKELALGIKSLKKNEQLVISLFYHKELNLTEIGQVLGLTTSRILQIHRKAIYKLQNTLQKFREDIG